MLELTDYILRNALRRLRLLFLLVDVYFGLLVQDLEHVLVLEFVNIVGGHFFRDSGLLVLSKVKTCQRHRALRLLDWPFSLLLRAHCDIVELVEVLELKEKAVMDIALRAVGEDLVAAFALDELALRPKLGEELHDDVDHALVAQDSIFALDFEPLFGPSGVDVAKFAAQFDAGLDLGDEVVRDVLETDSCADVVSDVVRNVLRCYRAVVTRLFNIYYIILFPFLEVIFVVLAELLALDVLSRQRPAVRRTLHVLDHGFILLVERPDHGVQPLANAIQERHALLLYVLLHRWHIFQLDCFREIQDSQQALIDLHRGLELCHLRIGGSLGLSDRTVCSSLGLRILSAPLGTTLVQDPVLVVGGWVLLYAVVDHHVAEHEIILPKCWLDWIPGVSARLHAACCAGSQVGLLLEATTFLLCSWWRVRKSGILPVNDSDATELLRV